MNIRSIVAFTILALLAGGPALADDQERSRSSARPSISEAQAVRIARGYGMVEVRDVERDDGGWEIEGRDHRGRDLKVTINRRGRVTDVERGDRDD